MYISRELGMHSCESCGNPLVDDDFLTCGIDIEHGWMPYFSYRCRPCGHEGTYLHDPINGSEGELPGDFFRQLAQAMDSLYCAGGTMQGETSESSR